MHKEIPVIQTCKLNVFLINVVINKVLVCFSNANTQSLYSLRNHVFITFPRAARSRVGTHRFIENYSAANQSFPALIDIVSALR